MSPDTMRAEAESATRSRAARAPLTVVHALAPARFGGLEQVVQALAAGQHLAGHQVEVITIVATPDEGQPLRDALERSGVRAHTLLASGRSYLAERRQFAGLCRRLRPDVVHTHGYRPDVLDAGVAMRLGIPTVATVHGFTRGGWKNRLYEWLQRRAYRRFSAVVAVSRPQVEELVRSGVPRERIHLLPNAWNPGAPAHEASVARELLAAPRDAFHIGWVGRLSREKGADVLLDALRSLGDLPYRLSVLGDGPERAALGERAVTHGVAERVQWHGFVERAGSFFPGFDAFVLSSRTEGAPIALFEAMAAGVPIVATRVGGVPDIISEAEGLLVPPDDPQALAAALRAVHADREAALSRARAARARLEQDFGAGPWFARYEALYHQLQPDSPRR